MFISSIRNPLHCLIDLLTSYERALWHVHHADTPEAWRQALAAWRACHPLAWQGRVGRDDAIRGLADPVKAWLANSNSRHVEREDFKLVEEGATVATVFAVSPSPICMPEVYSERYTSREELGREWEHQGDRYWALCGLI